MNNLELRQAIKNSGLTYYEVAHRLKVHENTLGRKLRYELPQEEKEKIFKVIRDKKMEG